MPPLLLCWLMTSEVHFGGMAVDVEPSHQFVAILEDPCIGIINEVSVSQSSSSKLFLCVSCSFAIATKCHFQGRAAINSTHLLIVCCTSTNVLCFPV